MKTDLPLNDRIKWARVNAGLGTRKALFHKLKSVHMPIKYSRLTYLEKQVCMPTPYEFAAIEAATGADANCIINGQCMPHLWYGIHRESNRLSNSQIEHMIQLNKAMIPVVEGLLN